MGTKYVSVPKKFDVVAWSSLVNKFVNLFDTIIEAAEYMGVSHTTLIRWRDGSYDEGFPYPSMTNFIKLCNAMDVDPSGFFTWE